MLRAAARLALGFALFLALAETARNWGDWQWWPFWLVDYLAALLLALAARRTLRETPGGGAALCGAWGFTTAMFYMSFWSHIASLDQAAEGNFAQRPLTLAIGILWAITLVGFSLALAGSRERAS